MSAIEEYVADLGARLRLRPEAAERFLDEVADHLHTAAEQEVAAGLPRPAAEQVAVRRFGSAREIAFAANGGAVGAATRTAQALARFGAAGSVAVLTGTLLASVTAALTTTTAVFGLPPEASPSASSITHWLAVQPGAGDWRTAAALENADDSLVLRGGAALLAALACGAVALVLSRRYAAPRDRWTTLLPALAFTAAAVGLVASRAAGWAMGDWGWGQALCDATVALVAAAAYWVGYVRHERELSAR